MVPLFLAGVFFGFVGVVFGAYWLLIVRPERKVLDRLRPRAQTEKVLRGVLKREHREGSSEQLDAFLGRLKPLTAPTAALLEQAGSRQSVQAFLITSALLGLVVAVMISLSYGWRLGVPAGLVVGALPTMFMRRSRTKRMLQFEEHFPGALDLVSRALRAGHALPTGLGMVADEAPQPVCKEFRILFDEQSFGLTLPDALRNFARRVPLLDARFFVVAVLIQREAGGNLAEVLDNLSTVIRERFKVKREIMTKSAHGRMSGWVLALLPVGLFVLNGIASGGETVRDLLNEPVGQHMLEVALGLEVLGILVIQRIVKIDF